MQGRPNGWRVIFGIYLPCRCDRCQLLKTLTIGSSIPTNAKLRIGLCGSPAAVFVAKAGKVGNGLGPSHAPVIDLSVHARYWVEDFLHAWFRYGLSHAKSEKAFAARWREIVEYALAASSWNREKCRRWFYLDHLANELIGITGEPTLRVSGEEFRGAIREMTPTLDRWCNRWLESARVTAHFAYFLSTPAGQEMLPHGSSRSLRPLKHSRIQIGLNVI